MEDIRIGVYICWCGNNIAKMVDVEEVSREMAGMPGVVVARDYKYMCSDLGQDLIISDIRQHNLNRVVVSACSPRIHELTFRKALQNAGLNPYMFEMANIREHDSWVHTDRREATNKAKSLVAAAIRRVQWHESLDRRSVDINPATLVVGGGLAGLTAALEIADAGQQVYLVEKGQYLGGVAARLCLSFPYLGNVDLWLQPMIKKALTHPMIRVFLNSQVVDIFGYIGNFETKLTEQNNDTALKFGNIVVATGLKPFDPSIIENYKYGILSDVITSLEFEDMLKTGRIVCADGLEPEKIAIIHCVGSRNKTYHEYCSRTCCLSALKYDIQIRSALPDAQVCNIYSDMRAVGKGCEELYTATSGKNVIFLRYDQHKGLPVIRKAPRREPFSMIIEVEEELTGEKLDVPADMIILMAGMEARENAKEIAHAAGISMCGSGFYIERHPKLDPVGTTTDGVYVVGTCQSPKDMPDTVNQARAAAGRILASISCGSVEVEVTTAIVNEDICCGCQTCIKVCPYTAIRFDTEKGVSVVNEILCKGCGTCGSACPTGAIKSRHFTDRQILAQIEGMMNKSIELQEAATNEL